MRKSFMFKKILGNFKKTLNTKKNLKVFFIYKITFFMSASKKQYTFPNTMSIPGIFYNGYFFLFIHFMIMSMLQKPSKWRHSSTRTNHDYRCHIVAWQPKISRLFSKYRYSHFFLTHLFQPRCANSLYKLSLSIHPFHYIKRDLDRSAVSWKIRQRVKSRMKRR